MLKPLSASVGVPNADKGTPNVPQLSVIFKLSTVNAKAVLHSFVVLPSTSVPVIIKFGYVPVTALIPAPISVTVWSGLVLFTVITPAAELVLIPTPAVTPTTGKATLLPLLIYSVCPAKFKFCNSFVTLSSGSVLVTVTTPATFVTVIVGLALDMLAAAIISLIGTL